MDPKIKYFMREIAMFLMDDAKNNLILPSGRTYGDADELERESFDTRELIPVERQHAMANRLKPNVVRVIGEESKRGEGFRDLVRRLEQRFSDSSTLEAHEDLLSQCCVSLRAFTRAVQLGLEAGQEWAKYTASCHELNELVRLRKELAGACYHPGVEFPLRFHVERCGILTDAFVQGFVEGASVALRIVSQHINSGNFKREPWKTEGKTRVDLQMAVMGRPAMIYCYV